MICHSGGTFVYLAYLDDSDTKQKTRHWQVMSGVIVDAKAFKLTEVGVAIVPELLMPAERLAEFEEFHACELYGGFGVFAGIDRDVRLDAIGRLLAIIQVADLRVVYGGVDLDRLRTEVYGSADPLDISFRMCVNGIDSWADQDVQNQIQAKLGDDLENYALERMTPHLVTGILQQLVIVIMDECPEKRIRETLQRSYRFLRPSRKTSNGRFSNLHDDMYFGDSRYSIGIQLADLCSYFIARHLEGDSETDGFYQMIEPHLVHSQLYPPAEIAPTEETAPEEIKNGD